MPTFRSRTRGSQTPSKLTSSVWGNGPNPIAPASGVDIVGCYGGTYGYFNDFVTKGFRKTNDSSKWVTNPMDSGKLVVVPSDSSTTTYNTPDGNGRYLGRTWSGDALGFILGPICPLPKSLSFGSYPDVVNIDDTRKSAIIGCLNKIDPVLSQSIVTAGELDKSVHMILDRARKIANALRALKKGDIKALDQMFPGARTKRYPKKIAIWNHHDSGLQRRVNGKILNQYTYKPLRRKDIDRLTDAARLELEYRYGWTPLVHDIVNSLKAINAQFLRMDLLPKKFYTASQQSERQGEIHSNWVTPSLHGGTFSGIKALTHKVSARAYAKYTISKPEGLGHRMQEFGIFDAPRAIWDFVPLSFVFDWFIPVGSWLAAVVPKVGVNVIDSGVVTTMEKSVVRRLLGYTPDNPTGVHWPTSPISIGAQDSFVASVKNRSIGLPIPLIPPTEVNLNLKRIADAVALLRVMR